MPYRTWKVVHPCGIGVRSGHTEVTPGVSRLALSELFPVYFVLNVGALLVQTFRRFFFFSFSLLILFCLLLS